jgi:cytochrome oxidase Cu insertion factor (SCO1/SenC/PrrC family)
MSKAVLAWLGLLFVAMGGTFIWLGIKYSQPAVTVVGARSERDRDYQLPPPSAGDVYLTEYTLTERNGRKLGTDDLAGKVYVTNFFFSTCPTTCLQQNQKFETVQKEFGPKGVQFVSITCDPDTDTPSRLTRYADEKFKIAKNDDSWWFLTGDLKYIRRIAGEFYLVHLDKQTHTERFEVRDKWGNPRGSFEWKNDISLAELKLKLNSLLAETEPPADVQAAAKERAAMVERAQKNTQPAN